jgi:Ca2+/Na+ antiporter
MECITTASIWTLDSISKIANIIIASFTFLFTVYIFFITTKKVEKNDDKNRKYDSLKTIILEHNLKKLFSFYEKVRNITQPLLEKTLNDDEKQKMNEELQNSLTELRLEFTDLFLAVDKILYNNIKKCSDLLIDKLTNNMFDEGINLCHQPKFESEIVSVISESKTEIVKHLYEYNS